MEIPVCYILKLREALRDIYVKSMLKSKYMYARYFYVHKEVEKPRCDNFHVKTKCWAWQGHYHTKVIFFGDLFGNADIFLKFLPCLTTSGLTWSKIINCPALFCA